MNEFALKLFEVLIKRRQEPPTPPEVIEELRQWWTARDREWEEQLRADNPDTDPDAE